MRPIWIRLALAACLAGTAIARQRLPPEVERGADPTRLAELGRLLFHDRSLSTPVGQSCASCHAPEAGFRFPDARVNLVYGVATGAIPRRVTSRSAPTISYASFVPPGPPAAGPRKDGSGLVFSGGLFSDGRADDLEDQAAFPFQNPNEMNDLRHGTGSPELVVHKVRNAPYAGFFREVFGERAFTREAPAVFADVCRAIAAYERSPEVSPFSSKHDAFVREGFPLTEEELDGLRLVTGTWEGTTTGTPYRKNAQCIGCHEIEDDPANGPRLWTSFVYANIGVPRNEGNPFYRQTNAASNPVGYNPLGEDFVDLGLGGVLYPREGLPPGNRGPGSNGDGDYLRINGTFRVPTLRNVDKRPYPLFVKAYMHNGAFKDLKAVVHFYNTRNLTTAPGEVIDFTRSDPYGGLRGTPLWPRPEVPLASSIENPSGAAAELGGRVGNLGLTEEEEDHIVAFLETLSDGYPRRL